MMTSPPSTSANLPSPGSLLHDGAPLLAWAEAGGWIESLELLRPTHWGPTVLSLRGQNSTDLALTCVFVDRLTWGNA